MPERTNYLVLAPSHHVFERWLRLNNIKPREARYVLGMHNLRGVGDFSLIVFGGWEENQTRGYVETGEYAITKAKQLYFPDTHKPEVDGEGRIIRWVRR